MATQAAGLSSLSSDRQGIEDIESQQYMATINQFNEAPESALLAGYAVPDQRLASDSAASHAAIDRRREDLKAMRLLSEAERNDIMTRALLAYTQAQLESAANLATLHRQEDRRLAAFGMVTGVLGLIVAILTFIFKN